MITYETKACKTVIDFFLIRKCERKLVRDVKVVHEECIKQHKLLICVLDLKEKLVRSKVKFMKRCKVWKLKEAETEAQVPSLSSFSTQSFVIHPIWRCCFKLYIF